MLRSIRHYCPRITDLVRVSTYGPSELINIILSYGSELFRAPITGLICLPSAVQLQRLTETCPNVLSILYSSDFGEAIPTYVKTMTPFLGTLHLSSIIDSSNISNFLHLEFLKVSTAWQPKGTFRLHHKMIWLKSLSPCRIVQSSEL